MRKMRSVAFFYLYSLYPLDSNVMLEANPDQY